MQDLESTVGGWSPRPTVTNVSGQVITIFAGESAPVSYNLANFGKPVITFGREPGNDIVIPTTLVSRQHGRFTYAGGKWYIEDIGSTNGIIYNYQKIRGKEICDGDFLRIDDMNQTVTNGVLIIVSASDTGNKWNTKQIFGAAQITIGRDPNCGIVLPHVSVSKCHAVIVNEGGRYFIIDNNSTNGVVINGRRIFGKAPLNEKDIINITNSKLIFTSSAISYCTYKSGISVDASDVVIERKAGRKKFITCNHVNVNIKPGELVAVIGGSGAGKSTVLNAMSGYLKPASGNVYINGVDLYHNFDSLKKLVGYVPQQDIVYDNLTLHDMLAYTAKLRLPGDVSEAEREACISKAIEIVELTEKKNAYIKALSGGQKKRASIAVELLSDPNLLFLDEPSSGLDPGTERSLMLSLRKMADNGKTVILVTHSTLQLKLCDKILFMGKGGNLTFFGNYDDALKFFGVTDIVDIYNLITEDAPGWARRYESTTATRGAGMQSGEPLAKKGKIPRMKQLAVLSGRYAKLIANDKQRLLILLLQAPILAVVIWLVAISNNNMFKEFDWTKSILFVLSCCAFWIGMFNSIQEVCKERTIMKREYMTGMSLTSYISSKLVVLGALCFIQSLLLTGVFSATLIIPNAADTEELAKVLQVLKVDDIKVSIELLIGQVFITTFFTSLAATAVGLLVSSLVSNPDRAMTFAPFLLMPQLLLAGALFTLDGVIKYFSVFTACRWGVSGYSAAFKLTAEGESGTYIYRNLTQGPLNVFYNTRYMAANVTGAQAPDYTMKIQNLSPEDVGISNTDIFTANELEIFGKSGEELKTLLTSWGALILMIVVCVVIARLVIGRISKENS